MIVLIDDNSSVREGVVTLVRAQPGFHVIAPSVGTRRALHAVGDKRPALVLLNLRREGHDNLTLAQALHQAVPESRVIVMGSKPVQEDVAGLVRAGVSGFLMANASLDRLLRTIQSVARGIQVLPSELTHTLFGQINELGIRRSPSKRLSDRRRAGRVEVTAWSLELRPFELDPISLV